MARFWRPRSSNRSRLSDDYLVVIPVDDQVLFAKQESIKRIGQIPGHLLHPQFVGTGSATSEMNSPRGHFHDEEQVVRTSPPLVQTSTVVKSIALKTSQWALRKVFQVVRRFRSDAGSMPCSLRMLPTV